MRQFACLFLLASARLMASPAHWIAQAPISADFAFDVRATGTDNNLVPQAIRVRDRASGNIIQEITVEEADATGNEADGLLALRDANGDGRLDLVLPVSEGGTGHILMANFYLFDAASGRFVLHRGLSDLPNVTIAGTLIETAFRTASTFGGETYRWRGKRLQKIGYGKLEYSSDGRRSTRTECRLAGTGMRCKTVTRRVAAGRQ